MVQLEFELIHFGVAVLHFSHCTLEILSSDWIDSVVNEYIQIILYKVTKKGFSLITLYLHLRSNQLQ